MHDLVASLLESIKTHQEWAIAIIFLMSFGESLAFVGLLIPGTVLLVAAGTLMRAGALPYFPLIASAILGAVMGDVVSYMIGRRLGTRVARLWPFSRNPGLLPAGIRFFERHGGKSVFIGRFFGPVRSVIPLAAGIMRMPPGSFWLANIAASLIWAPMLLFAGDALALLAHRLFGSSDAVLLVFVGIALVGVVGGSWAVLHVTRRKQ